MLDNYKRLKNGVIKQLNFIHSIKEYNIDYIKNSYDSPQYKEGSTYMSYLRLGYLLGNLKKVPDKILDVGYGNGDFLKAAKNCIPKCFGFEINNYDIPIDCFNVDNIYNQDYDVVCFFDVLEHFEDIYEIQNLKTNYIYISLPECHYTSDEWFLNWKHRKPDEHLWHFNKKSLRYFMKEIGFKLISYSNIEDTIRKGNEQESNILSGIFQKIY